jgi:hypothetical protein
MIPDDKHRSPLVDPPFRDADGCAVFPGGASWSSDEEYLGCDLRTLHIPIVLGDVGQFELAYDCYVLLTGYDVDEEEKFLRDLVEDPVVSELARELLDRLPSEGGEIAFENEEPEPARRGALENWCGANE